MSLTSAVLCQRHGIELQPRSGMGLTGGSLGGSVVSSVAVKSVGGSVGGSVGVYSVGVQ